MGGGGGDESHVQPIFGWSRLNMVVRSENYFLLSLWASRLFLLNSLKECLNGNFLLLFLNRLFQYLLLFLNRRGCVVVWVFCFVVGRFGSYYLVSRGVMPKTSKTISKAFLFDAEHKQDIVEKALRFAHAFFERHFTGYLHLFVEDRWWGQAAKKSIQSMS